MRTFEYRQPRVMTHFSVEFIANGNLHHGMCTDVSDGGIRAEFETPVPVGSVGSITLLHHKQCFKLEAVVAHLEGDQAGLRFICRTPQERLLSEQFVAAAEDID